MSISKDGGKTWEWELVNEFVDYPSQNGGHKGNSASFIDPTFIQGGDGTVYMMADAWPAGTGIWGTGGASCESTGFDENGNFLISRGKAGAIAGLDADQYTYYCDAAAKQTFSVDGAQVELVPIKDKDGALTGSWVDAYFDLYTVADGAASRTVVKQHESGKDIQANVFYSQSEWKAYPTCYIWLVKGTPTQDGIDWGEPSVLNVKRKDDQPFTGICPGGAAWWFRCRAAASASCSKSTRASRAVTRARAPFGAMMQAPPGSAASAPTNSTAVASPASRRP